MTEKDIAPDLEEISSQRGSDIPVEQVPVYPERILEIVRTEAKAMLISGERNKQVQFGWEFEGGNFRISRDKDAIVDPKEVDIEGEKFYFGIFKK